MRKTIYLWLWLFILPALFGGIKAETALADLEKLDLSALKSGESVECYIVYKTQTEGNWLALDHANTTLQNGKTGVDERLYIGFTSLTDANRYDMKYCWKVTKYGSDRYIIEWSTPVSYAKTGYQYVDENGLLRSDGHSDWMRYYLCYMGTGGEVNTGVVNTSEPINFGHPISSNKKCWKYDETNKRMGVNELGAVTGPCNHARDFYFLKYEFTSTTEADIAAYQLAYDNALISKNEILALDNDLENLKAANDEDYGKFDASKIAILQKIGSEYTRDQYTTADDRATIMATITTLQSVVGLKGSFYRTAITPGQGWYRLKAKANNTYLNSNGKFEGTVQKKDGSQYFYLRSGSDVNTRFELYTFDGLKVGSETKIGAYGNSNHFQINTCGERGLYMRSGGSNPNKWAGINEDNTIRYEGNTADYLDNLLFFDLESLGSEETVVTLVSDGDYQLSFNGTAKAGSYSVANGKITVDGTEYQLVSYNGTNYSIGDDKVATLKADLTSYPFNKNKNNPNHALPYPGFRLTPVVGSTATEVEISSLTNFASGDLNGKKIKITGTVDFSNLENAGATDLSLIDNQPFHAYSAATLSNALKYTRAFNAAATGAYSTKEAPKWQTICLPFDVEKVDAYCPVTYMSGGADVNWTAGVRENLSATTDYWLYELTPTGFVRNKEGIKANVPYIIAFPYSWINGGEAGSYAPKLNVGGDVTFNGKVVAATESKQNEGSTFNMANNFTQVVAGDNVYVLDANGEYFEKGTASANPFRPYAVLPDAGNSEAPSRLYLFEGSNVPTDLSEMPSVEEGISVLSVPGGVNVVSENARVITICNVNGAELGRVNVSEGTQKITLPVGIFVIDGVKVVVNE